MSTSSSAATRPSESTTTRSQRSSASSTSCVTSSTVRGSAASSAVKPLLQLGARDRVERAERLVEQQHLLAGEQRAQKRDPLPHPARQSRGPQLLRPREPEPREQRRGAAARLRVAAGPGSRARDTALSSAVRHGSRQSRCGISAQRASRSPRRGVAEHATVPASGSSSPATSESSVDLPAPLRPTIPSRPRAGTCRSTPSSTRLPAEHAHDAVERHRAARAACLDFEQRCDIRSLRRHDPDQVRRVRARKRSLSPSPGAPRWYGGQRIAPGRGARRRRGRRAPRAATLRGRARPAVAGAARRSGRRR